MTGKKDKQKKIRNEAERAACANGFTEGRKVGFREGVHHIVLTAEEKMANEMGFASREKLVASGKLPSYWIAALVDCFDDQAARPPKQAKVTVEAQVVQGDKDRD